MENRFILEKNFLHAVFCNRYNEDKSCEVVHKWSITRFLSRTVDVLLRGDDAAISDDRVELEQIISLCLFSSSSYSR